MTPKWFPRPYIPDRRKIEGVTQSRFNVHWCVVISDGEEEHFGKVGRFYTMEEAIIFAEELDADHIAAIMTTDEPNLELTVCELIS